MIGCGVARPCSVEVKQMEFVGAGQGNFEVHQDTYYSGYQLRQGAKEDHTRKSEGLWSL